MENEKLPKEIDVDFIKSLKMSNKHKIAGNLLRTFRFDVKKAGKNVYDEEVKKANKIKEYLNICKSGYCTNEAVEGKTLCQYHLDLLKKSKEKAQKKRERLKKYHLCPSCYCMTKRSEKKFKGIIISQCLQCGYYYCMEDK